jgi:hypothetical protein
MATRSIVAISVRLRLVEFVVCLSILDLTGRNGDGLELAYANERQTLGESHGFHGGSSPRL